MSFYPIFLEEMIKFKRLCTKSFFLASVVVSPCLFILTFGWGLSGRIEVLGMRYIEFLVPGIVALSSMRNSFTWTALSVEVGRTSYRTFEEYLVSPVSPFGIMLGKVLSGCFRGLFASAVVVVVMCFFGVRPHIGGLFVLSLLLNCIPFASLGVICGMRAKVHGDVSAISNFFLLPMSLFCGTFFPLHNLPRAAAWLVSLLPLTHSASCLRDSFLGNAVSPGSLAYLGCLSILLFSIGVFTIAGCRE